MGHSFFYLRNGHFFEEVIKPEVSSKESNQLDMGKSSGIMT